MKMAKHTGEQSSLAYCIVFGPSRRIVHLFWCFGPCILQQMLKYFKCNGEMMNRRASGGLSLLALYTLFGPSSRTHLFCCFDPDFIQEMLDF